MAKPPGEENCPAQLYLNKSTKCHLDTYSVVQKHTIKKKKKSQWPKVPQKHKPCCWDTVWKVGQSEEAAAVTEIYEQRVPGSTAESHWEWKSWFSGWLSGSPGERGMSATQESWQLNNHSLILLVLECQNRRLQFPALCSDGAVPTLFVFFLSRDSSYYRRVRTGKSHFKVSMFVFFVCFFCETFFACKMQQ